MKRTLLILLFAYNSMAFASCENMNNPNSMYNRFYQLSFIIDTKKPNEQQIGTVRKMSRSEAKEAWACVTKAASLNGCKSLQILELYYRHGIGKEEFGVEKNIKKANHYKQKLKAYCK